MPLTIHHLQVSQSERLVFLAEELNLTYTLTLHQRDPLFSPQSIKSLNPLGQAPVIQDDPSVTLAESAACADYILQKYGHGRLSLPPSHPDFPHYLYWFHFANGTLQPQVSKLMTLRFSKAPLEEEYARRQQELMERYLGLMDRRLQGNQWLAGSEFTAADCMVVFSLTTMRTFQPLDLSAFPSVLAYLRRVTEREGYKRARARGDPDLPLMIDGPPPAQYVDKMRAEGRL